MTRRRIDALTVLPGPDVVEGPFNHVRHTPTMEMRQEGDCFGGRSCHGPEAIVEAASDEMRNHSARISQNTIVESAGFECLCIQIDGLTRERLVFDNQFRASFPDVGIRQIHTPDSQG